MRHHLPDSELIVTFDGVRAEQESRRADYEESIRRTLWKLDHHYRNAAPFIFESHSHQSGMLRSVFDEIRTPLILYVEADTPLVTDEKIDWDFITKMIDQGVSNCVRLHHEGVIPKAHRHLMHGTESGFEFEWNGSVDLTRTSQWSQRPHVASTAYYRRILDAHFSPEAKCFIEDVMHGAVQNAWREDGMAGWLQHRLHIYDPGGGNMKRSYHTDGRAGEAKYDASQVF